MKIERRHPNAQTFGLLLCVIVVFGASAVLGQKLGMSKWAAMGVAFAVLLAGLVAVFGVLAAHARAAEAGFAGVAGCTTAELRAGMVARVRLVLVGPAALSAPTSGARCVYYRATALIETFDGSETYWEAACIRSEGELARARDSTGEVELDLRPGIEVIGRSPLHFVAHEDTRTGDPLQVGITEAYRIRLETLEAGDEVEVVGRVEHGAEGRLRIVPTDRCLQLRSA